jgi:hypothetical protein
VFTRNLTVKTNVNSAMEFASLNREEIISLLRSQKDLFLVAGGRSEPKVSSLWKGHYYVSSR